MHFLACMLARIWSPQEATAIWAELVDDRRQRVKQQAEAGDRASNFFAQQAALYDTEWPHLQRWDASARAWLQIADNSSLKAQQKKVELIVNNLSVAVQTQVAPDGTPLRKSGEASVYHSVLHTFCTALSTLDCLIAGKPQRILDGGVLLGFTSWHLYPDLVVLGPETKEVSQKDPLVAECGIATLSIAYHEDPHGGQDGVYWSLPLANLRYYGTAQRSRSSLHDSKLSFSEFPALILGASLDSLDGLFTAADILKLLWKRTYAAYEDGLRKVQLAPVSHDSSIREWVKALLESLDFDDTMVHPSQKQLCCTMAGLHLLSPLVRGVDLLLSGKEQERKRALQLVRYGANSATGWIGNPKNAPASSFFGICNLDFVLQTIINPSKRVKVLRDVFRSQRDDPEEHIIRFRREDNTWAYASLYEPQSLSGRKRNRSEFESVSDEDLGPDNSGHEKWIFVDSRIDIVKYERTDIPAYGFNMAGLQRRGSDDLDIMEFLEDLDDDFIERKTVFWDLVLGIHNVAGVYRKGSEPTREVGSTLPQVPLPIIHDLLTTGALNLELTLGQMECFLRKHRPSHFFSLLALGRVIEHYRRELRHVNLSMSVIKHAPVTWTWAKSLVQRLEGEHLVAASLARAGSAPDSIYPSPLTRQEVFASILQFESGTLSASLDDMDPVIAISSSNSLFIAQRLLEDPMPRAESASRTVAHAIGNVGKPGIALLFSPEQPRVREHDVEKWHVVNHNPFNGSSSGGSFGGSSLHMSFTGWEGPLRVRGPSGFRGMEAYNLETLISMHDHGEWVADLNILKALNSFPDVDICGAIDQKCRHDKSFSTGAPELVSIDCWEELLFPADKPMVLRSGSSWMARLTAVSIAYARGYRCFLLPTDKSFCWSCVVDETGAGRLGEQAILFIY
ncbi:uncharacterized protein BDV17DRAFT_275574 [Aspergillus undulatus]|uniref:uncharacterized protein n=1 Tax=Aspergillus undulatus TaxID=1810928 RepID=UPI003CCC910B